MSGGPFDELSVPGQVPAEPPRLPPEIRMQPPQRRPRPAAGLTRSGRWDAWLPLLNNRLILSGLGLVVVLLLIAIVLVAIGHGSDAGSTHAVVAVSTPRPNTTALPSGNLTARVTTTVSIRNGPSATYGIVGTIPKGATVPAVGRNDNNTWVQVQYSNVTGWVDVQFLQVTGDVSALAVAGPGPAPVVDVPTQSQPPTAIIVTIEEPTSTPTEETPVVTAQPTRATTPTPTEAPQRTATPAATDLPTP
jgi:uncharacterized protein YraI